MNITSILIDDEPKALAILKNKLERLCPEIKIIGESQNPEEGLTLIETLKPQLVFLDIAMPGMSGFDLLSRIEKPDFELIFATAFDEFAIKAIQHSAIGYLMKPISNEELKDVVGRVAQSIDKKTALQKNKNLLENLEFANFQNKKIIVPITDGFECIKIENIIMCEGEQGYTRLHFTDRDSMLSSYSLGHFKDMLSDSSFFQAHKSFHINLDHVEKYLNTGTVVLTKDLSAPLSRAKKQEFLELLNQNLHG
ncbi:MAG: LytR/AlgR family response regulator transcription factor [Flavobacteriales bacterium]